MPGLYDDLLEEEEKKSSPLPEFTDKGRPMPPALGSPAPSGGGLYDDLLNAPAEPVAPPKDAEIPAWQVPGEFIKNGPQNAVKFFGGLWQMATHPQETGEALGRVIKGGAANLLTPEVREAAVQANPGLRASIDSANAVGAGIKEDWGSWKGIKHHFAKEPVEALVDVAGVVPGAGAVNPLRAVNPLTRGTGAAVRATSNALNPEARLMLRSAEGFEDQYLNQLRDPAIVRVPGSVPDGGTAVAQPGGSARWQELVKSAKDRLPTRKGQVEHERHTARTTDIDRVGRTHTISDEQLDRAGRTGFDPSSASIDELRGALRDADSANYGPIDSRMVTADDQMLELLNRPSGDIVQTIAREIAAEEGRPFQVGANAPAQSTPSTVLGPDGRPLTVETPAQYAQYRGEDLIRIKKAFDRLASSRELRAKYAIDDDAARQIAATRSEFVNWMEADGRLPEHRTAVTDSAAWRTLIDRRQAGELFGHTLMGGMGPDQLSQKVAAFVNLFDSPRNAVKGNSNVGKASTFDYDNWAELLTPEDMEILTRNLDDLSREKLATDQAKSAGWHSGAIDEASPGARIPGSFLNPKVTILNALARGVTGRTNTRVSERVANALLTPDGTADLLERAIAHRDTLDRSSAAWRNLDESIQLLHRQAGPGYNALNTEREDRKKKGNNSLR